MKKASITLLLIAVCVNSGCTMFEVASYRHTERVPLDPPVAATANPDTSKWYESLAAGVGDLVSFSWIVGICEQAKELGESIVFGVRDVKTQTQLDETKVKYFCLFNSGNAKIEVTKDGVKKE